MVEWVGIVASGLIGAWGVVWARKAHRLAQAQDDRAKYRWRAFVYSTGPTKTEDVGLKFINEGQAIAWDIKLNRDQLDGFAVVSRYGDEFAKPGEAMVITVRHDELIGLYPTRLQLRWRTSPRRGRLLESWVDVSQWQSVAAEIRDRRKPSDANP